MKSEDEIRNTVETYSDMVRRVCFVYLKNYEDCEDVFSGRLYQICDLQ